jgi:hypothetical protein
MSRECVLVNLSVENVSVTVFFFFSRGRPGGNQREQDRQKVCWLPLFFS